MVVGRRSLITIQRPTFDETTTTLSTSDNDESQARRCDTGDEADDELTHVIGGGQQQANDDDDDGDDVDQSVTLRAAHEDPSRSYSNSPSRLDGSDLLGDLYEMSNCADRIDLILDQTSRPSSREQEHERSRSPAAWVSSQGAADYPNDEVD